CHQRDLRAGLDTRTSENGRRAAGCCRTARSCTGRIRTAALRIEPADTNWQQDRYQMNGTSLMTSGKHPAPPENTRRVANKVARREALIGWAFVLPALFMYMLFVIVPFLMS